MEFNIYGLLLAIATTAIIYSFPILKLRKKGLPIPFTNHNILIAAVLLGGTYLIYTGLLGLLG